MSRDGISYLLHLKFGSALRCVMNKKFCEKTFNYEKHVREEISVYLKLGSGRRCYMSTDIVENTF